MRSSIRRHLLLAGSLLCALMSSALLSSCASTTPRLVEPPQLKPAPPPAECTKPAFEAFDSELAGLPDGFAGQDDKQKAKTLLSLKAGDTGNYQRLRAQAIRCAR